MEFLKLMILCVCGAGAAAFILIGAMLWQPQRLTAIFSLLIAAFFGMVICIVALTTGA